MFKPSVQLFFCVIALLFLPNFATAQCEYTTIQHESGTEQVACSDVTVTKSGSVGNGGVCTYGPYWLGPNGTGSVTFNFAPAISGVRIGLAVVNNMPGLNVEELRFQINGAAYPIVNPGVDDGCRLPCIITGAGNITCEPADDGNGGSWSDVVITENITTLRIENAWILGTPNGTFVEVAVCCAPCPTDPGAINAPPQEICGNGAVTVPETTGAILESGDLLQYVLYTNENDPKSSIIASSNVPTFNFNPATMQYGVYYFISAGVANNLGGNLDLNDPCLEFTFGVPVIWNVVPTVSFTAIDPNACAGECVDITATFTGEAPFTLTYEAGNGPATQVFDDFTGVFQVCFPTNASPGVIPLQAISVVDAWCTCSN